MTFASPARAIIPWQPWRVTPPWSSRQLRRARPSIFPVSGVPRLSIRTRGSTGHCAGSSMPFLMSASNPLSVAAFTAAYREGGPWLDALGPYLRGNRDLALDFFAGVDADRADVLGTAAVGLEVVGERRYDRGLSPFAGK